MMEDNWPTFNDILLSYQKCRIHKKVSPSQIKFELHLGKSLTQLHDEIHSGHYTPSPSQYFIVTHPKPREIFAANFKDRVIHHLIIHELEKIWEKKFIESSFACRLNKGTQGAIKYAQNQTRRISQGGIKPVWALQLDIEKFFITINRHILTELMLKHINHSHKKLRELIKLIYEHDSRQKAFKIGGKKNSFLSPKTSWLDQLPHQGIPIGNLTSQFGANVYLTALDHFILRQLRPRPMTYLRYMDDLLFLDLNSDYLSSIVEPINDWLIHHRQQKLNPHKTKLTKLAAGISFLGYQLKQIDYLSEPLQIFVEPKKKWNWISNLRKLESIPHQKMQSYKPHHLAPFIPPKNTIKHLCSLNSQIGSFVHARSYLFRKKTLEKFIQQTSLSNNSAIEFICPWCFFKIKKGHRSIKLR